MRRPAESERRSRNLFWNLLFVLLLMLGLLLLAAAGVLALPIALVYELFHNKWVVLYRARRYLSRRYGTEPAILRIERVSNGAGPIPVLIPSFHWRVTIASSRFPGEPFALRYVRDGHRTWRWQDPYFTRLLEQRSALPLQSESNHASSQWNKF